MLDKLTNLGFISLEDEKLSKEEKIILLHIYKSILDNKKIDFQEVKQQISQPQADKLNEMVKSMPADFSVTTFEKGIEGVHNFIGEKEAKEKCVETYSDARKYDVLSESINRLMKAYQSKKENLDMVKKFLSDESLFDEFCLNSNIEMSKEDLRKKMEDQFCIIKNDTIDAKIKCLNMGVRYVLWTDIREGKFEKPLTLS